MIQRYKVENGCIDKDDYGYYVHYADHHDEVERLTAENDELMDDRFTCPNCKKTYGWSPSMRERQLERENAELQRTVRGYEDPNAIFEGDEIWYKWKERALTAEKERDGLREYSDSRDESIKVYREEIKELREGMKTILAKRRKNLYETCPDCSKGCTHGEEYCTIVQIAKKACEVKE